MKLNQIIYLCLCFSFILSDGETTAKTTVTEQSNSNNVASFYFPSSSISEGSEIYFKVKANENSFSEEKIKYAYVDSNTETATSFKETTYNGDKDTETLQNSTKLDIRYFTITKKSAEYSPKTGNYIYINIKTTSPGVFVEMTTTVVKGTPDSLKNDLTKDIIGKYGYKTVDCNEYFVVFNVEDFDDDEEMHFKIKAESGSFLNYGIYYEYISGDVGYDDKFAKYVEFNLKTTYETSPSGIHYQTKYFNIVKKKDDYRRAGIGKYLLIYFLIDYGDVTITNTEEDEGKFATWIIIVIVVAVVVVVVVAIGCYCYRRKKQLAQMNSVNQQQVYPSSNVVVDQNIPYGQQKQNVYY